MQQLDKITDTDLLEAARALDKQALTELDRRILELNKRRSDLLQARRFILGTAQRGMTCLIQRKAIAAFLIQVNCSCTLAEIHKACPDIPLGSMSYILKHRWFTKSWHLLVGSNSRAVVWSVTNLGRNESVR